MVSVKLSSAIVNPMTVGSYVLQPGTVYTDNDIDFTNQEVVAALALGRLVTADSASATAVLDLTTNPTSVNVIDNFTADQGLNPNSVGGV